MKTRDIYRLLAQDITYKKTFHARYDNLKCEGCGESINRDDSFYFFGEKMKICATCHEEIFEYLGRQLEF